MGVALAFGSNGGSILGGLFGHWSEGIFGPLVPLAPGPSCLVECPGEQCLHIGPPLTVPPSRIGRESASSTQCCPLRLALSTGGEREEAVCR